MPIVYNHYKITNQLFSQTYRTSHVTVKLIELNLYITCSCYHLLIRGDLQSIHLLLFVKDTILNVYLIAFRIDNNSNWTVLRNKIRKYRGYRVRVLDGPVAYPCVGLPEPYRVIIPGCRQNNRVVTALGSTHTVSVQLKITSL